MKSARDIQERLAGAMQVDAVTGCHNWTGGRTSNGYGVLMTGSRTDGTRRRQRAHRSAYEAFVGPIPNGLYVCHRCDNRVCINPAHLFLGTHQDNMDDRESKGRNFVPKGEKNGFSKLTEVDVLSMRRLRSVGATFKEIAERFFVDKMTAMRAVKGQQWAHVPPAAPKEKP